jgi:hypothetical protein
MAMYGSGMFWQVYGAIPEIGYAIPETKKENG